MYMYILYFFAWVKTDVRWWLLVTVGRSNGRVEISMPKITGGSHWSSLGVAGKQDGSWVKTSTEGW